MRILVVFFQIMIFSWELMNMISGYYSCNEYYCSLNMSYYSCDVYYCSCNISIAVIIYNAAVIISIIAVIIFIIAVVMCIIAVVIHIIAVVICIIAVVICILAIIICLNSDNICSMTFMLWYWYCYYSKFSFIAFMRYCNHNICNCKSSISS